MMQVLSPETKKGQRALGSCSSKLAFLRSSVPVLGGLYELRTRKESGTKTENGNWQRLVDSTGGDSSSGIWE